MENTLEVVRRASETARTAPFTALLSNPPYQTPPTVKSTRTYPLWPSYLTLSERLADYATFINPARWLNGGPATQLEDIKRYLLHSGNTHKVTLLETNPFPYTEFGGVCIEELRFNTTVQAAPLIGTFKHGEATIYAPYVGNTLDVVIPDPLTANIVEKIVNHAARQGWSPVEKTLWTGGQDNRTVRRSSVESESLRNDYGIRAARMVRDTDYFITENDRDPQVEYLKVYYLQNKTVAERFLPLSELQDTVNNGERVTKWQAVIPQTHCQSIHRNNLFAAEPYSLVTNSWLCRSFDTEREVEGFFSYLRTFFYRFLLVSRRTGHHALANVHRFVPDLVDFTNPRTGLVGYNSEWTDSDLKAVYSDVLTEEDWTHIERVAVESDRAV